MRTYEGMVAFAAASGASGTAGGKGAGARLVLGASADGEATWTSAAPAISQDGSATTSAPGHAAAANGNGASGSASVHRVEVGLRNDAAVGEQRHPRGFLVAIGGNEDKEFGKAVLKRVVSLPEGGTQTVEVIPTASSIPTSVAQDYVAAFTKLGIPNVRIMDIRSRGDAERDDFTQRIRECDVVFFTGGDQLRLTSLLGGTKVYRAIRDHYWYGGVVAGTSAGAAAMSSTMIFEGDPNRGMRKGNVQMTPGLGLIKTCVLDTHFMDRGRLGRLLEVVTSNPGCIGLGIGEDTGMIFTHGHRLEVIGKGIVVVVDGHRLRYTNISEIAMGQPIAVEGIAVHTLVEGHGFDLSDHRYLAPLPRTLQETRP